MSKSSEIIKELEDTIKQLTQADTDTKAAAPIAPVAVPIPEPEQGTEPKEGFLTTFTQRFSDLFGFYKGNSSEDSDNQQATNNGGVGDQTAEEKVKAIGEAATPTVIETPSTSEAAVKNIIDDSAETPSKPVEESTEKRVQELPEQTGKEVEASVEAPAEPVTKTIPEASSTKAEPPSKEQSAKEAGEQQPKPAEKEVKLGYNTAGETRVRIEQYRRLNDLARKLEADRADYIAKRELEFKRKNNGVLTAEAATQIRRDAANKFKIDSEMQKKLAEEAEKLQQEETRAQTKEAAKKDLQGVFGKEGSIKDRIESFKSLTQNEDGEYDKDKIKAAAGVALESAVNAISDLAKQLEDKIVDVGSHKSAVDTRLQGSTFNKQSGGSYWTQLFKDMTSIASMSIFYKQKDFTANIETLLDRGISFDLKQRAFLMTIQNKIATTFDVADGTLLRLIRIQQADTTAGRLGMESALNTFLNQMYETSEYLKDAAATVRANLEEMQSLMDSKEAVEVEYQVQKWLGSLYSVGMSNTSVTNISNALGQIAAGQVEGLEGGAGNLIIMAANDAGLSIADLLTDGIDASDTNKLLNAVVKYLADLAESSKDNKIVQQQLADVFGVKASDLRAATNLVVKDTLNQISTHSEYNSYSQMVGQLFDMAGSMGKRTSVGEMMDNLWENGQYTLAGSMANSPVSYLIYKLAKVVDGTVGGIDLPFVNVMGFGVDLNTTVSDLMRLAAVSGGILGSLGPMISGLGSSFNGREMLRKAGISEELGYTVLHRGGINSASEAASGDSISQSGVNTAGNSSGSDIKDSTIQEANDSKKQQMVEAKEEEEENKVDFLNTTVLKIYELLDDVAHGNANFRVKIDGYGLITGGRAAASAQGGVDSLISNSGLANSQGAVGNGSVGAGVGGSGAAGGGSSGSDSFNVGVGNIGGNGTRSAIDFGNWTTNV